MAPSPLVVAASRERLVRVLKVRCAPTPLQLLSLEKLLLVPIDWLEAVEVLSTATEAWAQQHAACVAGLLCNALVGGQPNAPLAAREVRTAITRRATASMCQKAVASHVHACLCVGGVQQRCGGWDRRLT